MNYKGICCEKGITVEGTCSFDYAIQRILQGTAAEKEEFKEWYFSGNWIEEEEE